MYWNSAPVAMAFPAKMGGYHDAPDVLSIIYTNRNTPVIPTACASAFIHNLQLDGDYSTSYLTTFTDATDQVKPEDLMCAFEASIPVVLKRRLESRAWHVENRTALCNESTASNQVMNLNAEPKKLFTVISLTANEAILQTTRKHLSITVSLLLAKPRRASTQKNVVLSHAVTCHTRYGRFCFTLLKPLFQNGMPALLKQMVQQVAA